MIKNNVSYALTKAQSSKMPLNILYYNVRNIPLDECYSNVELLSLPASE